MIEIQHDTGPLDLDGYARNHPDATWDDFGRMGDLKSRIKEQLQQLQGGLCIYCERKLNDNGHIDHVKPKSQRRDLTFRYDNMVCSCNSRTTCGHFKRDRFLPIEPGPDCNKSFYLHFDGTLRPHSRMAGEGQGVQDTLDILGLNNPSLKRERAKYISAARSVMRDCGLGSVQEMMRNWPFRHILKTISL